jgi:hypothetical protein
MQLALPTTPNPDVLCCIKLSSNCVRWLVLEMLYQFALRF